MGKRRETKIDGVEKIEEGRYRIRAKYVDPKTGKTHEIDRRVSAPSAADAALLRLRLLGEVQGNHVNDAPERLRFADALSRWFDRKAPKISKSTVPKYRLAIKVWAAAFNDYFLDAVTPAGVEEAMRGWRAEGLATRTINTRLGSLRTFAADEKCRHIVEDVRQFDLTLEEVEEEKEMERRGGRGLTDDEFRVIFKVGPNAARLVPNKRGAFRKRLPEWWGRSWTMVAVMLWCGLRFSEVSALLWTDVDFELAELRIRRRNWRGDISKTKSKAGLRDIPLNQDVLALLKTHRANMLATQAPGLDTGLVFPSRVAGKTHITNQQARAAMRTVLRAAGIEQGGRPLVHCTRHTANNIARRTTGEEVRRAIMGGNAETGDHGMRPDREFRDAWVEAQRARMMGHAREVPTYTHVSPEERAAAATRALELIHGRRKGGDGTGEGEGEVPATPA